MPLEHLLMIPRTWLIANRLHRQRRPGLARRACAGLTFLFAASLAAGFALTKPVCGPGCDHPS